MTEREVNDDAVASGGALVATMVARDRTPNALTETVSVGSIPRRGPPGGAARLAIGALIGRYVVVSTLGAGGMGVVYAGYDPELDRKVALKLLRPELAGDDSGNLAEGRTRLVREALALARLAHPNVVAIHDVGEHEGSVWLAMEHVDGVTLTAWLKAAPRTIDGVLEVMLAAGCGLAAAHEAGLLHRDFKPDNVMIGRDGRARVMDLGLARAARPTAGAPPRIAAEGSVTATGDLRVTQAGALLGTPAYMSPEQFGGCEADVRSDVYSYCVTLYEALYGEQPFAGGTLAELVANVVSGDLRGPVLPRRRSVPGWLRRIVVQGLAVEPARRFPSMNALLSAIERGRARARRRWWLASGLAVAAVAGGALVEERYDLARRSAACEAEGAVIDEVWDDGARARVRAGMLATGVRFAPHTLEVLVPWLDTYRDAWSRGRAEACAHATIAGDWDAEQLDRSSWCFEDRRLQLEATVEQLSTLSRASARRAVRIASYLDPVAPCLDPVLMQRLPTPPLAMRDEIRAIRATLSESDSLRHGGRYAAALEVAVQARERAAALGWTPVLALARFTEGRCAYEAGSTEEALSTLIGAYFDAQRDGSTEVAFRSARSLVMVSMTLKRYREAELWSRHADVFSASLDDPGGLDAAEGHYLRCEIHAGLGEYEAAAVEGEQAVALRTATLGPDHPITAAAARNLGLVYLAQGRFREAQARFDHAFAVWEDAVGHEHPQVAELAMHRGVALREIGRVDEALILFREALGTFQRVLGADDPRVLRALAEVGRISLALGQVDEAETMLQRVLEANRARHGPRHTSVAESLLDMAEVDRARGRDEEAIDRCAEAVAILEDAAVPDAAEVASAMERAADVDRALGRRREALARRREALARREASLGPEHGQLRGPLVALGDALLEAGALEPARQQYARALAIGERAFGADDATLVPGLTGLSRVALAGGDLDAAKRYAEQAARLADDEDAGPRWASAAHFALARALQAAGDGSTRPRSLAEQAAREYATCHDEAGRAEVERWLTELGP